jgi:hypothetical protein
MTITLDPIEIEESEESRRAREEQARRDDEARRAASEALDSVAPQLEQLAGGGDAPANPEPFRGRVTTPHAQTPGARVMESGAVVLRGEPQTRETLREHAQARQAMSMPARPDAPTPRMDQPAVASGGDPQMRAQQSPTFRAPQPDMRVLREPPPNPQRDAARAEVMAQRDAIARKPERPEPGRMDEGLPSEGQIGDARARDVMRLIAAALAGGFAGYSGRGGGVRARREADELTQQRQQGIARREQAKGAEVQRMDARAERGAAREQEMTLAQQRLAETARERDAGLDIQRQRLGMQERVTDARLQESERTRQEGVLLDDPSTPPSRQYQMLLRTRIASLPDRQRASIVQELGGADGISQMTGREIQRYLEHGVLPNPPQMRGTGGGGGAGGPRLPGGGSVSVDDFARLYVERTGRTPQEAAMVYADPRARRQFMNQLADVPTEAPTVGGEEILPGVRAGLPLQTGEAARMREGFASAMGSASALRRIGEIAERYGGVRAAISPEAGAAMVPELTLLRGMVATLGQTGTIQQGEVPTINAALPNPADLQQMTFGTFDARLNQWRRGLEDRVRANLGTRGVDAAGIDRAVRALWSGSFGGGGGGSRPQQPQQGGQRYRVSGRGGSAEQTLTPAQVEGLERRGFTVEAL